MLRFSPFMIFITVGGKSCRLSTNILLGKTVLNLVFFPMFVESCNHVYGEKTNSSRLELNREQFKSDRAYPAHRKNCDKKRKSSYFREKVVTNLTKNRSFILKFVLLLWRERARTSSRPSRQSALASMFWRIFQIISCCMIDQLLWNRQYLFSTN